jgi:hypothetical protein
MPTFPESGTSIGKAYYYPTCKPVNFDIVDVAFTGKTSAHAQELPS